MPKAGSPNPLLLDHAWYHPFVRYAVLREDAAATLLNKYYETAVDLGTGDGYFLTEYADHFGQATGCDLSPELIDQAKHVASEKQLKHLNFFTFNLNNILPFDGHSVDLVVSTGTIEYLLDPEKFLQEMNRILKPNGELILHTMNLAFIIRRLQLLCGKIPTFSSAAGWQGGVIHNFTWPTMIEAVTQAGLTPIQYKCSGLLPPLRMWWKNLLCSDIIIKAKK